MGKYSETYDLLDVDYSTNQSPGYMFLKLLVTQFVFLIFYSFLVLLREPIPSVIKSPIFYISAADAAIGFLVIFLNSFLFIAIFMYWQSVEYRISIDALTIKHIFSKKSVNLEDIQYCGQQKSILGRLFNYGTVVLQMRKSNKHIMLRGIPYVAQFHIQLQTRRLAGHNLQNMQKTKATDKS